MTIVVDVIPEPGVLVEVTTDIDGGGGGASVFSWANASSAVWSIAHNLGHHPPAVTVIDGAGNVLTLFDRSDPDVNHTTLTFAAPVAGVAYLI